MTAADQADTILRQAEACIADEREHWRGLLLAELSRYRELERDFARLALLAAVCSRVSQLQSEGLL